SDLAVASGRVALLAPRTAHGAHSALSGPIASANHATLEKRPNGFHRHPAGARGELGLEAQLTAAVQRCRQSRRPLSLVLLELDEFSDVLLELGPAGTTELMY